MSEEAILLTSRRFQSSGRVLFEALDDCAFLPSAQVTEEFKSSSAPV